MRSPVVVWVALLALVALSACDGARARPLQPNVGSPARDGSAAGTADGAQDAGSSSDSASDGGADAASEPEARDAAAGFDARPAPDALPGVDATPLDARPAQDVLTFDAEAPRDGAQPDAQGRDAAAADALAPDALAPDAQPAPADGGVRGDAGTAACTSDSQCASGRCHPLYGQCVPQGQRAYCDTCSNDSECGLPGDHCLDVSVGGMFLERICAQACNVSAECPRGYLCSLSNHCYPVSGAIRAHTCASLRDMLAGEACNSFGGPDTCGVPNYEDGTCVPTLGCTVGCVTTADCPERSVCSSFVVADYCVAQ